MTNSVDAAELVVMKFGGAALRDGDAISNIARIIHERDARRVVVASAMEGVTDHLARSVDRIAEDETQVYVLIEWLRDTHEAALKVVAPGDQAAEYALRTGLERLERLLYGIAYTQECTPRIRDMVLSFGERLSIPVLAAAIRARGGTAVHLDAEHAGVRSLGPFGNARPDMALMAREIPDHLGRMTETGEVPVVTGFYGVDPKGNATLFGRGGSDYVASLLAVALKADAVELWKDVPGFLTTDPNAVASARLVPELGYDEAAELAYFGARVLHPRAVEPLEPVGIPIRIKSIADPSAPGSIIRGKVDRAATMVRSAASKDGLAILKLNGAGMAYTPGVAKRVFDLLQHINVLNMATSQATFSLLVHEEDADQAAQALDELVGGVIQSIEVLKQRSLVCVVGRGLGETPGSAAKILESVSKAGVNVEMISVGASDIAIDFIVKSDERETALRGVHGAFLEQEVKA